MKYPYIGKLKSGNSGIVLFCSDSFGAQLNCKGSGWRKEDIGVYSADDDWDEDKFKNITAEYLANTYGEVKSKAHAEFIVKLAEVNGLRVWGDEFINDDTCAFVCYRGVLEFHNHKCNKTIIRRNLKQITIPLPPECKGGPFKNINADNIETMKFDIPDKKEKSTFIPTEITFNVPSGLDLSFSTIEQGVLGSDERHLIINVTDNRVYEYDDSSDDEWPKVGDEVQTNFGKGVVELAPDVKGCFVVQVNGGYLQLKRDELGKPKTPEQELNDELCELCLTHCDSKFQASEIARKLMVKYNITKKGEGDES